MSTQSPVLARLRYAGALLAAAGLVSLAWDLWRQAEGRQLPWTSWATDVLYVLTGLFCARLARTPQRPTRLGSLALTGAWVAVLAVKVAGPMP